MAEGGLADFIAARRTRDNDCSEGAGFEISGSKGAASEECQAMLELWTRTHSTEILFIKFYWVNNNQV